MIRVRHDDTAVQTDAAEDAGPVARHHLHSQKHPSAVSPSLTFSAGPLFHFDPATLNPRSTRQHGRQAATQTGDRKQLINIVTPLHLPGPTRGGELSASKTKQPPAHTLNTHTRTNQFTIELVSGPLPHKQCHSQNVEACRHKIFTTHRRGSDMT